MDLDQSGKILYADVRAMWDKLSKIDPYKSPCVHCGAPSLNGPHSLDCPWVKLDRLCAVVEGSQA